jgi:GT2 family glycosyltransferase
LGAAVVERSEMNLAVSVIIPVYKGGEAFRACLSSLAGADPSPSEIVVVTDGDSDESGRLAETFDVRVLELPERGGPARARNLGAQNSSGDVLLFVDADVTVYRDIIERVTDTFRQEPDLAALFGSYDEEPARTNFLSQYKNLLHHYVHQMGSEEASTFWAACGGIRREVFLELGGFDETYRRPCVEDIELGYRLRRAGYRIKLCKDLQVKHLKRWNIISLLRSDFFDRALPWTLLILRDRRFIKDLNVGLSGRASVFLIYLLLGSLAAWWWWKESLALSVVAALSLLFCNVGLYRFFWRKRGLCFALQSVAWHWLYYLYSGVAFVAGAALYLWSGYRSSAAGPPDMRQGEAKSRSQPEPG